MERKKAQVIMLPTTQDSRIFIHDGKLQSCYDGGASVANDIDWKCQHLYIVSDDKIKEGDWCLFFWDGMKDGELGQIGSEPQRYFPENGHTLNRNLRKIIATTDPEFSQQKYTKEELGGHKPKTYGLPQPSKAFIEKYCKKGGIDEVLVEYESWIKETPTCDYALEKPKVNSHNEIIIHPIKDSWSREEVEQHIRDCSSDIISKYLRDLSFDLAEEKVEEWIKENL